MATTARNPLDELAEEFAARLRRGETPSVEEYAQRHPRLADEIRELFPTLAMMERLKPDGGQETGSFTNAVAAGSLRLERFGDYRILREIGRGGMGVVYEAEQVSLGRRVALKVLPAHHLLDARQIARFRREAQAAARLHHTNIVPVFGVGEQDGVPYYVMQFIPGQSLHRVIEELRHLRSTSSKTDPPAAEPTVAASEAGEVALSLAGGFSLSRTAIPGRHSEQEKDDGQEWPSYGSSDSGAALPGQRDLSSVSRSGKPFWRSVAQVGVQLAEALAYAHAQDVLHRDVKPSNLLLDARGEVWVTDFGLARLGEGGDLTHTGDILGTLRYMPPEALRGTYDRRSDIYSAGLTLYEMLTLRPAFNQSDRGKLFSQVAEAAPLRPRRVDPRIPRDLETIVLKAISLEPEHRYQYADQLADDLRRYLEDKPIRARRVGPLERAWRWRRRNPVVAMLAFFLLVAIMLGLSGFAWKYREAVDARELAESRTQEKQRLLAHQYVASGVHRLEEDDPRGAGVWFAEALRQDPDDPHRAEMHRIRLATIFRNTPRLSHMLFHDDQVREAYYSPDGSRILTATANAVRVWDAATGQAITPPLVHEQHIWTILAAPDGEQFLTLSADPNFPSNGKAPPCEARLYETETGELALLPLAADDLQPRCTAFTPDGKLLLTRGHKRVHVWDLHEGDFRYGPLEHPHEVQWFWLSPDGRRVVTYCAEHEVAAEVRLWDVPTGKLIGAPIRDQEIGYEGHCFSRDGRRFITRRYCPGPRWPEEGKKYGASVWSAETGSPVGVPLVSDLPFRMASLTPDGRFVLTKNYTTTDKFGRYRLWDVATGQMVESSLDDAAAGEASGWTTPAFSPEGDRVVTVGRDLTEWRLPGARTTARRSEERRFVLNDSQYSAEYSPDGRRLLLGRHRVVDLATGREEPLDASGDHDRAVYHPEGTEVLTFGDSVVRIWSLVGSDPQLRPFADLHYDGVTRLVQSRDGRLLAVLSGPHDLGVDRGGGPDEGLVRIYDFATGELLAPPLKWEARAAGGAFDSTGRRLLVWDRYGKLKVIETAGGKTLCHLADVRREFNQYPIVHLMQAVFTADGQAIFGLAGDGAIYCWDASTGTMLGPPRVLPEHVYAALSPDGRSVLLLTKPGKAVLLATSDLEVKTQLGRIIPPPNHAVFSPSGRIVATVGNDGLARVWNVATGQLAGPLISGVSDPRFSFDDRLLATRSDGNLTRVWDISSAEPVSPPLRTAGLPGEHDREAAGFFGPDSRSLFAVAEDHLRVWDLRPESRPVEDLARLSQLAVSRQIDQVGGYSPWDVQEQEKAWQTLEDRSQDSPSLSRDESRTWRRRETWEATNLADAPGSTDAAFCHVALFHLDRLLADSPQDETLLVQRGDMHAALEDWPAALADYDRAAELQRPPAWEVFDKRSKSLAELGRTEEAAADLARAIELGRPIVYFSDAWRIEGARDGLSRRIEKEPQNANLYTQRGWMNRRVGRSSEALADFDRAIQLGQSDSDAWRYRGEAHVALEQWPAAIADFTRSLETPEDRNYSYRVNNLLARGQAYAALGDYEKSLPDFAAAWEQSEERYRVSEGDWSLYQLVRLAAGRADEFRESCAETIELLANEQDPQTNAYLAWTCSLLPDTVKDWTPVVERARIAVLAAPDDAIALRALGASLYRAGEFREARDTLAYSQRFASNDPAASLLLSFTEREINASGDAPTHHIEDSIVGIDELPWSEQLVFRLLHQGFQEGANPASKR